MEENNHTMPAEKNNMMPLIIGAVVLLLIVGGAYFFMSNNKNASTSTDTNNTTSNETADDNSTMNETEGNVTEEGDEMEPDDSGVKTFEVAGSAFAFDVKEMKVKKGDTVRIVFTNSGGTHDWVIDEFDARTQILEDGDSETIEFVADTAGTFEYYCSVGNHRAMGMVGNLIVEE